MEAVLDVLVVDDEEPVRKVLLRVLRLYGYRADAVATLAEARERGSEARMLLADRKLPDGDGETLRAEYPHVVTISGKAPCDVMKPFTNAKILAIVAATLAGEM